MILQLLFIFFARIIDVSMGTIRTILIIRGDKWPAAGIGFFEIMVYTVALGMVVDSLDNPVKLLVFCTGFAMGVLVGSFIEEKLAMGFRGLQVTIDQQNAYIIDELREEGYPVTCWEAHGKLGPKTVLNMIVKRNSAEAITEKICAKDPDAFVVYMEPKYFQGGSILKKK
ncbi:MAG TPA: DUF5698 domain-containing protein [Syntrophomonas sp.]|nr:DUF5698 domain-containing protein [Syntrophomonas sp.]